MPVTEPPVAELATWHARAAAFTVDVIFGLAVVATMASVALSTPQRGWLWWLCMSVAALAILLVAVNRLLLPTITGWSLGRALVGIAVVRRDGSAPGPWWLLARDCAHLLDTLALFVGWLWPLWDSRHRTFADLLTRTEVRRSPGARPDVRRLTAAVLLAAALLCAAGAGLGYLVVYRHDQAVDRARAEIGATGPRIVEQLLSYDAKTLQADFDRARSLTTDSYRDQLTAQQQGVAKAGATTNEYWTVNSSVLTASQDRASMLLLLQGQRITAKQEARFITATVRANFEKGGDGQWRVADLTVLTKPRASGPPK